jgi:hypothetical protein
MFIEGCTYIHRDRSEGFTKYAVKLNSGAMIYIPVFINTGIGIQKFIGGNTQTYIMVNFAVSRTFCATPSRNDDTVSHLHISKTVCVSALFVSTAAIIIAH